MANIGNRLQFRAILSIVMLSYTICDADNCTNRSCPPHSTCANAQETHSCLCDTGYKKNHNGHCNPVSESLTGVGKVFVLALSVSVALAFLVMACIGVVCWKKRPRRQVQEANLRITPDSLTPAPEIPTQLYGPINDQYEVPVTKADEASYEELNNESTLEVRMPAYPSMARIRNNIDCKVS